MDDSFGWGAAGPWYYTGTHRGDNEIDQVGVSGVVVNGRRYVRVGPGDTSYLRPYALPGDIIDHPEWGQLISLELGDRFESANSGFWDGAGPVLLAAGALAAFLAPAVAAGAVAEGGAVSGGAVAAGEGGGLSADLLSSIVTDTGSFVSEFAPVASWEVPAVTLSDDLLSRIVTDTGSFASEFTPAAWAAPSFSLPSLPSGASSLLGAAQSFLGGAADSLGALGVQGGASWLLILGAVVVGVFILSR